MRLITIIAFFALLITPLIMSCSAEPDSVTTESYKISFDLGLNKSDYKITISDPKETETLGGEIEIDYSIKIRNNTGFLHGAEITAKYFEHNTVATGAQWKQVLDNSEGKDTRMLNYHSSVREIDGASGAISSATVDFTKDKDVGFAGFIDAYQALYQPTFDPSHVVIEIFSYYPWEQTLQLLKTIHVEKINETS